jgi:glucokinase
VAEKLNNESLTLGVDLGGTKIETSLVDTTGHILASQRRPTQPERGPDGVIGDIIECVKNCLGEASKSAQALGVGMAGQIEKYNGIVRFAPNLGWRNVPLGAMLEEALVLVDDLICLFVGTGVGGGIVSGSKLLEGCDNSAGELGHLTIMTDGRQCHCRNRGCLEAYAVSHLLHWPAALSESLQLQSPKPMIMEIL